MVVGARPGHVLFWPPLQPKRRVHLTNTSTRAKEIIPTKITNVKACPDIISNWSLVHMTDVFQSSLSLYCFYKQTVDYG